MTASLILALLLLSASPAREPLATLRPQHPRLIGLPEDLARVKCLVADDSRAAGLYRDVRRSADSMLKAPPLERVLERRSSMSMLTTARKCVERIYTLATAYRVSNDRRYADRAIRELLAVSDFSDWNPSVFLDTAEMTHAVAIGYDWLFDVLSPQQRRTVRQAIVDKGLREAQRVYRKGGSWAKARHNWNQVCNGAMAIGALAVAEDERQLANEILKNVRESMPLAMSQYAPDGAWPEGPGYWAYATRYTVAALAAMESALGTDCGLAGSDGFSCTGDFRIQMTGPTKRLFNFGDSSSAAKGLAAMAWLARKFRRPEYSWYVKEYGASDTAQLLWWFDPCEPQPPELPNDAWFRHTEAVAMRSRWHDPRAVFVGFRGGDNGANHSHLELGNFVLDADGQRWVMALGPDAYSLPGYFGRQRWTYYRAGTVGQNTLLIDGRNQDPKATAPITAFYSSSDRAHAVADLSAAYAGSAGHVARGVALLQRRQVLVQDELQSVSGRRITWQIHTLAKVKPAGDRATLKQQDETMVAQILTPAGAQFEVEAVEPPPPQRPAPGVSKLTITLTGAELSVRLAVLFTPGSVAGADPSPVVPLGAWPKGPTPKASPSP